MSARLFFAWRMFEEAAEQQEYRNKITAFRAKRRAEFDPLEDLSDTEFRNRYRLTKHGFIFLCQELKSMTSLRSTQRVSLETKVGSYQRPVGVAKNLSQKMCSVYIEEVTQALIHPNMLSKYIQFPDTPARRRAVTQKFFDKYGIPGIVGCIDGSHFRIFGPPKEQEHLYYCRKHYHSLNVQMVCDSECRILNVNSKYGGASHDAFVWENSLVNSYMQSLHTNGEIVWLLGDSGYPQRPWIMTPIINAAPASREALYNDKHIKARVVIENTFGRLKNQWRCLNKDRVLHYKPAKCAQIIQACCVLYNIGINFGYIPDEQDVTMEPTDIQDAYRDSSNTTDLLRGRAMRSQLVQRLL